MTKATVRWFDKLSQEGIIRVNGESIYINNDPVHGYLLTKGQLLDLVSGQEVEVEVLIDYNWKQISKIKVA